MREGKGQTQPKSRIFPIPRLTEPRRGGKLNDDDSKSTNVRAVSTTFTPPPWEETEKLRLVFSARTKEDLGSLQELGRW